MFHLYLLISCVNSWSFPAALSVLVFPCAKGDDVSSTNHRGQWSLMVVSGQCLFGVNNILSGQY